MVERHSSRSFGDTPWTARCRAWEKVARPATSGVSASTFSTAAGWTTVVETDGDAVPANQPVLIERGVGTGRVLVFGDSNTLANYVIGNHDNQAFGVRLGDRVLFKI